ncbi:hypothetical protein MTO96_001113 [Rhipicephalus appendiculatus]
MAATMTPVCGANCIFGEARNRAAARHCRALEFGGLPPGNRRGIARGRSHAGKERALAKRAPAAEEGSVERPGKRGIRNKCATSATGFTTVPQADPYAGEELALQGIPAARTGISRHTDGTAKAGGIRGGPRRLHSVRISRAKDKSRPISRRFNRARPPPRFSRRAPRNAGSRAQPPAVLDDCRARRDSARACNPRVRTPAFVSERTVYASR